VICKLTGWFMVNKKCMAGICVLLLLLAAQCKKPETQVAMRNTHYITNQAPLTVQPYTLLPLGAIKPEGWLKEQLVLMKNGMTGHLDALYEKVVGPRNGWLGGDGDGEMDGHRSKRRYLAPADL